MKDPYLRFTEWFADAKLHATERFDPTAMTLATATRMGKPSARIVLLKHFDEHGFVFYTNMESRKSQELKENPQAALCFHWKMRQVRVSGKAEPVSDAEADEYFASRPYESRLAAIASHQSHPLDSRKTLTKALEALSRQYSEVLPPPRPAFWSGWRIQPDEFEFWQEGKFRLHERELYTRTDGGWNVQLLYP